MNIKEKLDKIQKINKTATIISILAILPLSIGIMILITFLPVFPSGHIEGKTNLLTTIIVNIHSKIFLILAGSLIVFGSIIIIIAWRYKKKYKDYIL